MTLQVCVVSGFTNASNAGNPFLRADAYIWDTGGVVVKRLHVSARSGRAADLAELEASLRRRVTAEAEAWLWENDDTA